ncbi:unnamed protein product [Vicia faba]|uniref:DUF4218 domain-containing protein n=1 Tax=Vicia faba TaxID=3906 RepID=A0AAV1A579_VICFA|nr:unnamed protein product [Vicia faba]
MFASMHSASQMTWHHTNQTSSGTMRHPSDGEAWKHFDRTHPDFAAEPRNVRLGLCSDGFAPYVQASGTYGMLSGWGTHGKMGCPHCMGYTKAFTLDKGGKSSWFDCHRRFLPANHPYRRNKTNFKKDVREKDLPPPRLPPGVIWNQLLPIAFGSLPKHVLDPLTEISQFFRDICASALKVEDIIKLDQNIALILCKLEQVFPPGFFDSMEHLPVHLAYEAYLGGPVQYRWMYPFESTAEHVRRMTKEMGRPPLMIELITRTRTKKSGGFVDDRTQKAFDDYQTLLANFLEHNPQYRPAEGEPLNGDVDFYIWNEPDDDGLDDFDLDNFPGEDAP